MKKTIAILVSVLLTFSFALADMIHETNAVTIAMEANATTGFAWNGFVLAGDAVILNSAEGTYVFDNAAEDLNGAGGMTYYTLIPVKTGSSIITFNYARAWENDIEKRLVVLVDVDEDKHVYVTDVTESGVIQGTVVSVDTTERTVLLNTETHGEIIATFDESMELPVVDEKIEIYTNGTMTMSLPAIMNVLAWNAIHNELARVDAE